MEPADITIAVSNVLRTFGKLERFVFYLHIEKGVSVRDVAEIVGMSQEKVGVFLGKVYERIREEVREDMLI